jgi:hypothetical protein
MAAKRKRFSSCADDYFGPAMQGFAETQPSKVAIDVDKIIADMEGDKLFAFTESFENVTGKKVNLDGRKTMLGYKKALDILAGKKPGDAANSPKGLISVLVDEWNGTVSETINKSRAYKQLVPLLEKNSDIKEVRKLANTLKRGLLMDLAGKTHANQMKPILAKHGLTMKNAAVALKWLDWIENSMGKDDKHPIV